MNRTVVLAYSGGLDTSVCVKWLADRGWRVIAFMADVGQGLPGKTAITRAKRAGAARVVVKDLRHEFIQEYVWPALKADAVYEGKYLLATALSRPLISTPVSTLRRRCSWWTTPIASMTRMADWSTSSTREPDPA